MTGLVLLLMAIDWPQFRGPNGSGVGAEKNLPVEFGPEKNVVWKTELPAGHSSPSLAGEYIFVTAVEGQKIYTIGLNRKTGRIAWKREAPRPRMESMSQVNSPASPSPVSDGRMVYSFFGDFGLLAYGVDGEEKWRMPLGPFNNANGHGSSPVLVGDLLVLICDQDTDSYLLAVDKTTGKVRWKIPRPEVTRGYATPAVYTGKDGRKELLVPGAYQLISYDAETGAKLWWVNGMAWQMKGVPVMDGETIYISGWEIGGDFDATPNVPEWPEIAAQYDTDKDGMLSPREAPPMLRNWYRWSDLDADGKIDARDWAFYKLQRGSRNNICAIRPKGRGDQTGNVVWRYYKSLPYVPAPLIYNGVLYMVKDGGVLTAFDPADGSVSKQARLAGAMEQYWASPVASDGKVYLTSQACKVSVLRAGAKWDVMRVNDLEDECYATPAIADGGLYIRTRNWLYFFRKQ